MFKGNTKYPCCFCLYNNYAKDRYEVTNWPQRKEYVVGQYNVAQAPLVTHEKFIFPTLHIKLGLWKQFIKYMPKECDALHILRSLFPRLILFF